MTKHTPGPWEVRSSRVVVSVDEVTVWNVEFPSDPRITPIDLHEDDNGEANARLIAAAPDLYQALERLSDLFADDLAELGFTDYDIGEHDALTAARAALSKARGET